MRPIRIYHPGELSTGGRALLTDRAANHVRRVLRLRSGDAVTLFNGDGHDYSSRINSTGKRHVEVSILERTPVEREAPVRIELLQGLCRSPRMDLVVQKATELGVWRMRPVIADRSVVRPGTDGLYTRRLEHWSAIAAGACEQSGRAVLPAIDPPARLDETCHASGNSNLRIMMDPGGQARLPDLIARRHPDRPICILAGPEGGLTDGERAAALESGFHPVAFGPRILRTETAAIAALTVIQYLAGDLGGA